MIRSQKTLRTAVELSGRGLHSGEVVDVRILPAPQDTGVEFLRTDQPDALPIPAHIRFQSSKDRRTRPPGRSGRRDTPHRRTARRRRRRRTSCFQDR